MFHIKSASVNTMQHSSWVLCFCWINNV